MAKALPHFIINTEIHIVYCPLITVKSLNRKSTYESPSIKTPFSMSRRVQNILQKTSERHRTVQALCWEAYCHMEVLRKSAKG